MAQQAIAAFQRRGLPGIERLLGSEFACILIRIPPIHNGINRAFVFLEQSAQHTDADGIEVDPATFIPNGCGNRPARKQRLHATDPFLRTGIRPCFIRQIVVIHILQHLISDYLINGSGCGSRFRCSDHIMYDPGFHRNTGHKGHYHSRQQDNQPHDHDKRCPTLAQICQNRSPPQPGTALQLTDH